jgi:UDP-N-acetyl-D-mannosaminuronic acid dehydrogenase
VTERLGRQLDEAGRGDVDLAYCPERIRQGRSLVELRELAQIVGGTTARAAARAAALFQLISPQVVFLTPLEAELAKLFCNAYLYINYALANQLYMLARQHDVDYQRVLEGLRAGFPRLHGLARAGFAAGPCLVKDTIQLGGFNPGSFPLGQVAMAINEGLPAVLVEELKRAYPLAEMTVGILGMAFKPNCDDPRDSLAYKLRKVLSLCGSRVLCTDPYVPDPDLVPLEVVLESSDLIVVGAAHDCYRDLEFRQPVFDVSGTIRPRATMSAAAPATDMVRGGERT